MEDEARKNLEFLKEMEMKLKIGFENKDPTMIEHGLEMLRDLIEEAEELLIDEDSE